MPPMAYKRRPLPSRLPAAAQRGMPFVPANPGPPSAAPGKPWPSALGSRGGNPPDRGRKAGRPARPGMPLNTATGAAPISSAAAKTGNSSPARPPTSPSRSLFSGSAPRGPGACGLPKSPGKPAPFRLSLPAVARLVRRSPMGEGGRAKVGHRIGIGPLASALIPSRAMDFSGNRGGPRPQGAAGGSS